jgi:hypothetical protein
MASDDYWRWRDAQDDRQWQFERARERSNELHGAILRGEHDRARWIAGVPPAEAASDGSEATENLENGERQIADEQYREHSQALLFNLRWAEGFLPQALLAEWTTRVERLDLGRPEAGLVEIEAIRNAYRLAVDQHEPTNSQVSRRVEWEYYVPRIGHEIEWLTALFRHVLTFR